MRRMQFVKILLKAAVMACLCSGAILVILAFMLYQWDIGENVVHLGILFIYWVSTFIGGIFAGKMIKEKRFLWGLCVGCIYFLVLIFLSLFKGIPADKTVTAYITTALICLGGGMLGGMIS